MAGKNGKRGKRAKIISGSGRWVRARLAENGYGFSGQDVRCAKYTGLLILAGYD